MDRRSFLKAVPAMTVLAARQGLPAAEPDRPAVAIAGVGDLKPIELPPPQADGGKSVLAALGQRQTMRNIRPDPLPRQTLSNLLWAAFGVNRPAGARGRPGRTAASASNSQEIDLYVALSEGVYLYEAAGHRLVPVAAGDLRGLAGRRGAASCPVNIFYVVDISRYSDAPFQEPGLKDPEVQKSYYYVATGLIAGNVYLFAASQGLAAWFHNCNRSDTARQLGLGPQQRVLFAQSVGYPA